MSTVRKYLLRFMAASLISVAGLALISGSEGTRRTAYPDPGTRGAPWTICRGHTGPEVHPGLSVSADQCDLWFAQDVGAAEQAVQRLVRVPLKQGEYDSLVSFVFNLGPTRLRDSTLLRYTNARRYADACNQYPLWKYANGMVLEGLVVRRTKEQTQCHLPGVVIYDPPNR